MDSRTQVSGLLQAVLQRYSRPSRSEKISLPFLMGVLNITPDSFSDGGKYLELEAAQKAADEMLRAGADILDIGGESTAPGSRPVLADVELRRIENVVRVLAQQAFLSIDTYKASVAERLLALGASMINDVSALRADSNLPAVIREHQPFLVLMYSKESGMTPHVTDSERVYGDIIQEISNFLSERIDFALSSGISQSKLILDPGMGRYLSQRPEDSWTLLRRLEEFVTTFKDFPILLGVSRKGFLGGKLSERDPISQLVGLYGAEKGVSILRTHHVPMAVEFLSTWKQLQASCEA